MNGFYPLLSTVPSSVYDIYAPFTTPLATDKGGGYSRITWTLDLLWYHHKRGWNLWSNITDNFNVGRFLGATFTFHPHDNHDYIVWNEFDFWANQSYGSPFYHPAALIQKKGHRIVQSRHRTARAKTVRVKIKPSSMPGNDWFMMFQLAGETLIKTHVCLIDLEDPFMDPEDTQGPITLEWADAVKPGNATQKMAYWWLWDTGENNGYTNTAAQPTENTVQLGQGAPYWQSLWGSWNQTIWIRASNQSIFGTHETRYWKKLKPESLAAIISHGPFVEKTISKTVSINMTYKFKFQFGGGGR